MTRVHKSGLPLATHIRPLSEAALMETIAEPAWVAQLDFFAEKIDHLDFLIWFATAEMEAVTPDMVADLIAAHWNISTGYYKTAASSLKIALDVDVAGLCFLAYMEETKKARADAERKLERGQKWQEMSEKVMMLTGVAWIGTCDPSVSSWFLDR